MNLNDKIVDWIKYDNDMRKHQIEIKNYKQKKEKLSIEIIEEIKEKELDSNLFKIPALDTSLQLSKTKSQEGMSYKFIKECFDDYFENKNTSDELIQYMKDRRKVNEKYILKRK